MELPPRTRRIPALVEGYLQKPGTTSAYAENTDDLYKAGDLVGNYLRVRGEYLRKS